ncbi:MAG: hypothetical protein OEZ47_11500, partial [Gammaproteobacteria bacterium]|nr:hypothetical protein [Gammaproteobacteria bacterium]
MYIVAKSANLISLIFLVGFSWIGLTSCTYQEAQEKVHFTAFLPTDKQITLNTSMIPASLSLLHSFPQAGDPEAVEKAIAEGKLDPSARNFVYYRDNSDGSFTPQVSSNHNRLPIGFENQSIDLTDFFDPFSVDEGQVNTESNRTSVGCGIADGEPNRNQDIFRYGVYSWCTMSVLKVALHRGITHYDSFHRVMTTILENIVDDADQMDTTYTYTNPSVQSIGANGMHVTMYYNDCASSRTVGDQGRTMCLSEADSSVYHKLLIRPLVPQGGTTVDTNIGSMEWIVRADSSVRGYISMSRNLMTANTVSPYAPPQVQFDFESDAEGKFQSFVVKFGTRVITSSTPARQWTWEANVFRITRIPGSGTVPGLWTVEGSIAYELEYANPILGSEKPEPDPTAETRVYFVAVTEDVFTQGRTLFKTILVPGKESTPTSTPYAAADWDKELHLWAAYKKLLESTFTEAHYTPIVGLPLSVRQWFTQSGTQIYKGGISRGPISKSADESRLAIAVNSELRIYERSRYGAYDLLGVCRPFGPDSTDRLTNPAFNPNNPDQVLVAEQSGSIYQARVVNISTIATSSTCDTDLTFAHPLTDPTPRLQYVDFTTVGSQTLILTQNNNFVRIWDITNNLTPILQVPSPTTSTYVAKFDSTGQRVLMTGYEGGSLAYGTYALDIATGNILTLRDDSCNFEPLTVCSHSMWTMTAVFNNPVLTNEIITSSVGGTATVPETNGHVFRWNISSWDPSLGSDTWLVSNSSSSRLVQNIAYTHADNSIAYANNAAINDAGTELAVLHNTSIDYYPVNGVGQIDAAAVRTVPLRAAATQPSTNYSYAPLYVNNDRHLYVTGNTSVIYKLDPTLNVKSPHAFLNGHVGAAYNAIYSSDGKYVLTPGEDGTAVLWQELDGTVVLKLSGHTDRVTSAVFTHGETRILTSSDDGTLRLWDVVDGSPTFGQTLQTYTGHTAGVAHVDYSDTFGRHRFASAGKDGTINIYSDTQATPIQSYPGVFTVSATVYPA